MARWTRARRAGTTRARAPTAYAYIEVHLAADTLVLQPIDYVGESLLPPGRYGYVLELEGPPYRLALTLRHDE
jgi:hypothetical protein